MSLYLTVDGGTTNTRLSLTDGKVILARRVYPVGAGAAGAKERLSETLREGIPGVLADAGRSARDITRVLASGMITSEFGLYPLPHVPAPAGIRELHESMAEVALPDIFPVPFVFIRGVKIVGEDFSRTDMMRGEETELYGLRDPRDGEGVLYVLPGSHSKIIATDGEGRIADFTTLLTGEMLAALAQGTILRHAVTLGDRAPEESLLSGFDFCREHGLNETLFKVRFRKNLFDAGADDLYAFFLGAVLCGEVTEILRRHPRRVVLSGRRQLREATAALLRRRGTCEVTDVPDEIADAATARGAVRIFEG